MAVLKSRMVSPVILVVVGSPPDPDGGVGVGMVELKDCGEGVDSAILVDGVTEVVGITLVVGGVTAVEVVVDELTRNVTSARKSQSMSESKYVNTR